MNRLIARLAELAAQRQTIGYGALAEELSVPPPGSIAKLTAMLEELMEEDAALGLPFRAALCEARLHQGLPAAGFFLKAQALGCFDGTDPAGFCAEQRRALYQKSGHLLT